MVDIHDPKYRFEERVETLMKRHRFDREVAEEVVRTVITEKEQKNGKDS